MLTYFLERDSHVPLYEQLYNFIKKSIETNELKANEKLPSKRKLATNLKISQITVETAYLQLLAEGYIESKERVGYFVLPYQSLDTNKSKKKRVELAEKPKEKFAIDFLTNQIDEDSFPYYKFAKIERDVLMEDFKTFINQSDYAGNYKLREKIADILFDYRGIEAVPEQIIIGSGSEHLISLLVLLLGRRNIFAVEDPGYIKNYRLYKDYGVKPVPLPLDEQGIDISYLRRSEANIVHTTPSHQFPSGIVTLYPRRVELLKWANEKPERYIIEDDYDSEFRFSGNPIPAMKSLDEFDKVIYMNSFSKSIASSFRVSFMVLPEKLLKLYQKSYSYFSCSVPVLTQMVLARFIDNGDFERHLNRMKNIYKNKRDELIERLKQSSFGNKIEIIGSESGLHFLVRFNTEKSEKYLIDCAKNASVRVYGLSEYFTSNLKKYHDKTLVLGYSNLNISDFITAVEKLEKAWTDI